MPETSGCVGKGTHDLFGMWIWVCGCVSVVDARVVCADAQVCMTTYVCVCMYIGNLCHHYVCVHNMCVPTCGMICYKIPICRTCVCQQREEPMVCVFMLVYTCVYVYVSLHHLFLHDVWELLNLDQSKATNLNLSFFMEHEKRAAQVEFESTIRCFLGRCSAH